MSTHVNHDHTRPEPPRGAVRTAHPWHRRFALAAATLVAMVASLATLSSPASAVTGLQEIFDTSPINSAALKTLSIECPPFHHAIGGSAGVYGVSAAASSNARILAAVPSGAGTLGSGFSIVASEQEIGTSANWWIAGTAICAPASSLPGLEYRHAESDFGSAVTYQATATCSPGKQLIGMGGEAWYNSLTQRSHVVLTGIRPNSAGTTVTVTGFEDETGFSGNWKVYATAVCIDPVGQRAVAAVDGHNTNPDKAVSPDCSDDDVHSLGFDLTGPAGRGGEVHLDELYNGGDWGYVRALTDATGLSGSWRLRGYAVCH